jgi:NTP pyrophosphatase (non-canonical NTP hydrolase)
MAKKKITCEKYCDFVESMASNASMKDFKSKLGTVGLGLTGEAGEVADTIKKILYQGKKFDEETRQSLIKEMGDVMWYVAFACRTLNVSIEEVIQLNVEKLQERYKTGKFTVKEFQVKESKKK